MYLQTTYLLEEENLMILVELSNVASSPLTDSKSTIIQPTTDDSIQSKAIPTYSPIEIIIFINIKIVGIIIGK